MKPTGISLFLANASLFVSLWWIYFSFIFKLKLWSQCHQDFTEMLRYTASKESLAPGPVRVPPSVKEYYQLQKVSSLFFAFLWNKYLDISTDLYHDEIIQENKELSMLLI